MGERKSQSTNRKVPGDQGEGKAVESEPTVGDVPEPATPEGKAGLTALLRDPGSGLVALDYDGTLAPIVADPLTARAHPGAPGALRRLSDVSARSR